MPPDLMSYQRALFAAITGLPTGVPSTDAHRLIVGDDRASAARRLHVYEHMYRARLVEALEAEFPRLARLLGAEELRALTLAYVAEHPSRHPSLRFLGQYLPAWLDRQPGDPVRPALARLEWARADVFDEVDQPTLTRDRLQANSASDFATLPLRLVAASRFIAVGEAALDAWDDPEGARRSAIGPGSPRRVVVWRQGIAVYHRALDADEATALLDVAAGTTLGVLCDALATSRPPEAAAALAFGWLSSWLDDGLLLAA